MHEECDYPECHEKANHFYQRCHKHSGRKASFFDDIGCVWFAIGIAIILWAFAGFPGLQ